MKPWFVSFVSGLFLLAGTAHAQDAAHALIMTIGDYPVPVPKLPGVIHDAATASQIAQRMGIPASNIRSLSNGQLTLAGMQRAFDELEAKLGGNDKVFIYYSGHGGRQVVREDNGNERCAESLLTHDAQGMVDQELEARLKRIAAKSQKAIVLIDACHSGGVTTRSTAGTAPAFVAKAYTAPGQNCTRPTNVLTRSLAEPKAAGSGAKNFVHIAAAKDSEISLDQPGKGGVASQAWLACLSGTARDADGSGALSAEEIRSCAQDKINQQLGNTPGYLPHHVTLTGNPAMVLGFAAKEGGLPGTAVPPAPTFTTTTVAASALATLNDIFNSRDDRRLVSVSAPKSQLRIGKDLLDFSITSREGGHVYVLMAGSDGKTFDLLFPNQIDNNNVIEPGATLRLPRPAWLVTASGPVGRNTLLAIVSDSPRNFAHAGLKPAGPFSSATSLAATDIQRLTSSTESSGDCATSPATRNLAVSKRCSSAYGAALLVIDEIN